MTHIWVRAEQRPNEERVGITPQGVAEMLAAGFQVTVEESHVRAIAIDGYRATGCAIAAENTWPDAPRDAIIFGLKELPEDGTPLTHRHILFGHAYKGQPAGQDLLRRFKAGGGTLYDIEYLVDEAGRRVAAFGYWAGYAGAAVALKCWAAQTRGGIAGPVHKYLGKQALLADLTKDLAAAGQEPPRAIVIGALGRVGTGAADLCDALGVAVT
jgi:saccharopine dehydrogenase (NAD+, L-lysine-forming)